MKGEADVMSMYQGRLSEAMNRMKNFGEGQEVTDEYVSGKVLRGKS